ncbi:MAG: hypothetical protein PWQ75_865 [Methanolobus sp.]|jgi:hypothetical protein|uniref:DUF4926 domain-containing protein n=1 Tax=Methanolobus sp. TaxID=1874737 RepID=UPI002583FA7E|nr:DUF4926 domain-containing protein [Methanolobus sp.]MDK2831113.1 hypothetical protein [Methanolobus sp.]
MKFSELDTVITKKAIPEKGIKKGHRGTVIVAFSKPDEAYDVEFLDDAGNWVEDEFLPDELEKYE